MAIDLSLLGLAFEGALFILFLIKAYGGVKDYIAPYLRQTQQDNNEKWLALQEQHAILIAKKKQLATQFLQQEKQIALLTAKLETWYKSWQNKQSERKAFFKEQAERIATLHAEQELIISKRRIAAKTGKKLLDTISSSMHKKGPGIQKEYVEHCIDHLSRLPHKEDS